MADLSHAMPRRERSFDLKKHGADERARFNTSVTKGKRQMPAWGGMLSDEEMDQLCYIRSKADN